MTVATPALDAWRRRTGPPVYDALWSAACWEMAAVEAHRAGQMTRARDCLERAAEIVATDGAAVLELAEAHPEPPATPQRARRRRKSWA